MKRGLLLFNPEATSVSPRVRDVIVHALASSLQLDVVGTKRSEHATHIARGAVHEGVEVVVSLGGDGTVNEVIQGIAGSSVPIVPLPGGGTNVFARTMGLPRDPIEATAIVLERIDAGAEPVRMPLGKVNDRYFAFCAGLGLDAAVVHRVERSTKWKQRLGDLWYVLQGVRTFYGGYPHRPSMTLFAESRTIGSIAEVIVCKSDPYTFLGNRPFRVCPNADQQGGLDATALTSLGTVRLLRTIFRALGRAHHDRFRSVTMLHDQASFRVESSRPVPLQVDGEYLGEGESFTFTSVPDALSVLV